MHKLVYDCDSDCDCDCEDMNNYRDFMKELNEKKVAREKREAREAEEVRLAEEARLATCGVRKNTGGQIIFGKVDVDIDLRTEEQKMKDFEEFMDMFAIETDSEDDDSEDEDSNQ